MILQHFDPPGEWFWTPPRGPGEPSWAPKGPFRAPKGPQQPHSSPRRATHLYRKIGLLPIAPLRGTYVIIYILSGPPTCRVKFTGIILIIFYILFSFGRCRVVVLRLSLACYAPSLCSVGFATLHSIQIQFNSIQLNSIELNWVEMHGMQWGCIELIELNWIDWI